MIININFLMGALILAVHLSSTCGNDTVEIVGRKEWGARPPAKPLTPFPETPRYVIICHTVTPECFSRAECVRRVRGMQNYHLDGKKWTDIGYNFMVGGDGLVYEGRGWEYVGAHSRSEWNPKSIGLAFIGDFRTVVPNEAQLASAQKLLEFGVKNGKLPSNYKLIGHRQAIPTISPGDELFAIIKTWPNWSELSANSTKVPLADLKINK